VGKKNRVVFIDYSLTNVGEFGGEYELRRYEKYGTGEARFTLIARYHEEEAARAAYAATHYRVEGDL
jgi:hypothetical protein